MAERLAANWRPTGGTIWIAAGPAAWDTARGWAGEPPWRGFVCIPDESPSDLSVVAGWDCVVIADGLLELEQHRLAGALLAAGARLVLVFVDGTAVSHRMKGGAA